MDFFFAVDEHFLEGLLGGLLGGLLVGCGLILIIILGQGIIMIVRKRREMRRALDEHRAYLEYLDAAEREKGCVNEHHP